MDPRSGLLTGSAVGPIVDPAGLPAQPWRNGTGTTRELCRETGWRVSLADIDGACDYSTYPGWQRWSCVVTGRGLDLTLDGRHRRVGRGDVLSYPGQARVHAVPVRGERVRNLNLTVDTSWGTGAMHRRQLAGRVALEVGTVAVWVLSGVLHTSYGVVGAGLAYLPGPDPDANVRAVDADVVCCLVEADVGGPR